MSFQPMLPLPGFVSSLVNQPTATGKATGEAANQIGQPATGKASAMSKPTETDKAKAAQALEAKKAAFKEFEGIFVSMLIKELRKGTELFAGDSTDSLGVLFDQHIGKEIGESGGIGIAKQLSRYVEAQKL